MPRYLQVLIEIPGDVTIADAKEYVVNELKSAGGCKHPDDPLFHGLEVVSVKSVRKDRDRS